MVWLTCSVRVVQLRIDSRLWMEKLEDQLMSAPGSCSAACDGRSKSGKGRKLRLTRSEQRSGKSRNLAVAQNLANVRC
jgi:hypothetical protein